MKVEYATWVWRDEVIEKRELYNTDWENKMEWRKYLKERKLSAVHLINPYFDEVKCVYV